MVTQISIAKRFINECWHAKYEVDCLKETLVTTCLHQKTIGKCLGIDTFICDCHDWSSSFPDFTTKILEIKEFHNLVICDVLRTGTHLSKHRCTNPSKNTLLDLSSFLGII